MRVTNRRAAGVAAAALVATASISAPTASAWWPFDGQGPTVGKFGSQGTLVDAGGAVVQGWTVTNLRPSSDVIPFPVQGRLWEASATDTAIRGTVTPIIPDMNSRAANGDNYRVIWNVALEKGVNPSTLAQGGSTTGKLYFDVTATDPNSVVYNDGVQDLLIWVK
ncbi:protein of unknown function (DUF1942) [Mycobacterium sp. JS623]|uniref:MPT63 family protein n=1 Tax=Mycobacterium sp. JS623 TaxID=212767 RepID=UPI0002A5527A|nr:MPT63 family protein [Mycobacterium sp. JS623]AGB24585.1 protein of unknown function (DUF1942) [Mycobacterium sp. JS623]